MNRPRHFNVLRPGEISTSEFERLQEAVQNSSPMGLGIQAGSGGVGYLSPEIEWAYAKITERNDSTTPSRYSWQLILPKNGGEWYDDYDAAQFKYDQFPAYEANGKQVTTPTYAIVYKGDGNWVVFFAGGEGGGGSISTNAAIVKVINQIDFQTYNGRKQLWDNGNRRWVDGDPIIIIDANAS